MIGSCVLCTNIREVTYVALDNRLVLVCAPCNTEHPRRGRYSFTERSAPERSGIESGGNRRRGQRHG